MLNQILNIIQRKPSSKTIAKNRLKLVLIQDRTPVEFDALNMQEVNTQYDTRRSQEYFEVA